MFTIHTDSDVDHNTFVIDITNADITNGVFWGVGVGLLGDLLNGDYCIVCM